MEGQLCKGKKRSLVVQTLFRLKSKWCLLSEPQNTSSSTFWPWCPKENLERRHLNTHSKRTSSKFVHQIYINSYLKTTSQTTKKKQKKIKPEKQKKKNSSNMHKGSNVFCCEFLFFFQIVIANLSCKFLLQIHIVNS